MATPRKTAAAKTPAKKATSSPKKATTAPAARKPAESTIVLDGGSGLAATAIDRSTKRAGAGRRDGSAVHVLSTDAQKVVDSLSTEIADLRAQLRVVKKARVALLSAVPTAKAPPARRGSTKASDKTRAEKKADEEAKAKATLDRLAAAKKEAAAAKAAKANGKPAPATPNLDALKVEEAAKKAS